MGGAAALPRPLVTVLQAAVGCFRKGPSQARGRRHSRHRRLHGSSRQGDRDREGTRTRLSGGLLAAAQGDGGDSRRLLRGETRIPPGDGLRRQARLDDRREPVQLWSDRPSHLAGRSGARPVLQEAGEVTFPRGGATLLSARVAPAFSVYFAGWTSLMARTFLPPGAS